MRGELERQVLEGTISAEAAAQRILMIVLGTPTKTE
jgi:hypothetical protein